MAPPTAVALHELHRFRRRKRIANLEWFEAAYRVYLTAGLAIVVTLFVASALGDERASADGVAKVLERGPAIVGLVAALAVAMGLRSGSRGGPLAIEPAEVRHVLLAPVSRRRALVLWAVRQVRFTAFVGAVAGTLAGYLAHRRLPEPPVQWMAAGAATGATIALAVVGFAMLASGLRIRRWLATLLALGLLGWAIADVAQVVPAPTTLVGSLSLWALRVEWIDLAAVVVVLAVVGVGLWLLERVSIEALERRTGLVGQLRFAVTVQDLRTVIVLRRQLALDTPRMRPWFSIGRRGRAPVWRRGWHGILRFPAARLARMTALVAVAALCLNTAFHGIAPLVVPAGLALFLVGLDAIEPLSQEIDQANRTDLLPVPKGDLIAHHLPVPAVVVSLLAVAGWGVAFALNRTAEAAGLAALLALPAALAGMAGALVSTAMGSPEPVKNGQLMPPEVAGMGVMMRAAWPLVIAVAGSLPVLAARASDRSGDGPFAGAITAVCGVALLLLGVVAWVRFGARAKEWWQKTLEEGQAATRTNQPGRS
ncbi:MAG TPA: hypothetical protein VF855_09250 [Acidimicrobiales bacterium]